MIPILSDRSHYLRRAAGGIHSLRRILFPFFIGFVALGVAGCGEATNVDSPTSTDQTERSVNENADQHAALRDESNLAADISEPSSRIGRYALVHGEDAAICKAAEKYYDALGEFPITQALCGYPFDWENSEFRQPDWERLDPTDNADAIQEFFTGRTLITNDWYDQYSQKNSSYEIREKIREKEYWAPLRDQVMAAFESGVATLERANFDLTNDGQTETVYRMTSWSLDPSVKDEPDVKISDRKVVFWEPCGPRNQRRWLHFARGGLKDDLSSHLMTDARRGPTYLFLYKGKSYYSRSAKEIDLNVPGRDGGFTSLKYQSRPFEAMCSFGYRDSNP